MSDAHAHGHAHSDSLGHGGDPYTQDHEPVARTATGEVAHASRKQYVMVGVILCVITAVEVGVFYVHALKGILIPLLIVLSVVKFVTVVQFFMHLKYDQKMLSRVFFGPLFLACLVVVGMIMLFKVIPKFAW